MIDYMETLKSEEETEKVRRRPLKRGDLDGQHPLAALGGLLMLWWPRDVRYKNMACEEMFMYNLMNSMETSLGAHNYEEGTLEYFAHYQANVDEYERFNLAAQHHNYEWIDKGCPREFVDPITGDETPVDTYVSLMDFTSKYSGDSGRSSEGTASKLEQMKPSMSRKACIRVKYQLTTISDTFQLGYAAYDLKGIIIYYNEIKGDDLAQLVRRSVQEIWGNPKLISGRGKTLDGITQLIQGQKVAQCRRDNTIPCFLRGSDATIKTSNPDLVRANINQYTSSTLETVTAYVIPVVVLVVMLIFSGGCLVAWVDNEPVFGRFLLGMMFFIGVLVASRKISQNMSRKASEIRMEKRFM